MNTMEWNSRIPLCDFFAWRYISRYGRKEGRKEGRKDFGKMNWRKGRLANEMVKNHL